MHKESTLALWRGRLAECERCGFSDEEHCEASGVSLRMLRLWRRRLSALSSPLELLEVPPPFSAPSRTRGEDSGVSLEACGVVIRLSLGFGKGTLCRVMGLLPGMPPC